MMGGPQEHLQGAATVPGQDVSPSMANTYELFTKNYRMSDNVEVREPERFSTDEITKIMERYTPPENQKPLPPGFDPNKEAEHTGTNEEEPGLPPSKADAKEPPDYIKDYLREQEKNKEGATPHRDEDTTLTMLRNKGDKTPDKTSIEDDETKTPDYKVKGYAEGWQERERQWQQAQAEAGIKRALSRTPR